MNPNLAIKQLKEIGKATTNFGEKPRLAAEGWDENWKTLIAIILSAQTRDVKTIAICKKLFEKFPNAKNLSETPLENIEKTIKSVNYYKTKAKNIKNACQKITEDGFVGENIEELTRLPGVGRKTANVYLVEVKKAAAIGVDTHVSRISKKMGWTKETNPHKIEKNLEKLFPKKYWNSINWILVRFGQSVGRSQKRENNILNKILTIKK